MSKMFARRIAIVILCVTGVANADAVAVVVGETGCVGRQQTVRKCWVKIPGVVSVTVLPRQSDKPGSKRTFVIESNGVSPTTDTLRTALGRREKHFPILSLRPMESPKTGGNLLNPHSAIRCDDPEIGQATLSGR